MKGLIIITIARLRRIVIRSRSTTAAVVTGLLAAAAALAQGPPPPFTSGLVAPMEIAFTHNGNLIVAEAGNGPNSGRLSLIDRTSGTRRTLMSGLPSGIHRGAQPQPSGPSGLFLSGATLYVTIGNGDAVEAGPAPGTERPVPNPSSPILSSLLAVSANRPLDLIGGNFVLDGAHHAQLKNGSPVVVSNATGEELTIRLVADFPNFIAEPRPDFPENVRVSNPFGVVAVGQSLFVVDASLNVVRRVDAVSGAFTTLTSFAPIANNTGIGAPRVDAVPDSIRRRGDHLVVSTLTGAPFPAGAAEVRGIDMVTGANELLVGGLTAAIDVQPLGDAPASPMLVLEFSRNLPGGAPGRLLLVSPGGEPAVIADNLITPTGLAADRRTGEVFITHLALGAVTRVNAFGRIPAAQPTAIVPVMGSVSGAFGSRFVTSAQMSNPHPFPISGEIRFGGATLRYVLAPWETRRYDDFAATIGGSGIGSAEVVAAVGGAPVLIVDVADQASAAPASVRVPLLEIESALTAGSRGLLITPRDLTRSRFNVGIRTLDEGATVVMTLHDSSGAAVENIRHHYGTNAFVQIPLGELFARAGTNQSIAIAVEQGSAFVYGATAGADASLQVARPVVD